VRESDGRRVGLQADRSQRQPDVLAQNEREQQKLSVEVHRVPGVNRKKVGAEHVGHNRGRHDERGQQHVRHAPEHDRHRASVAAVDEPDVQRRNREEQRAQIVVMREEETGVDDDDGAQLEQAPPSFVRGIEW
jgi:hypothetical protein